MSRRSLSILAVGVAVAAAAGIAAVLFLGGDGRPPQRIEVVVPQGAGALGSGVDTAELLPRRLEVEVGDTLVIDNRDDRAHAVGPYTVAAGQRLEHRFAQEGVIDGECTLHPSGRVTIVVG